MLRIVHLVDDTTAGGVMRVLHHICSCPRMARLGAHRVVSLSRGRATPLALEADILVSHLSISWRRLPALIQLRATHAHVPMVHVEHSYTEAFMAQNVFRRARFLTLLSTAYALFDRVVAVSAAQGHWLRGRGLVSPDDLCVIPSTVDLAPFLALPLPAGRPRVVGAIGRLEPQKGFDTLIPAFRACADRTLELHIYGDGNDRKALEALAAGDPRIRFRGWADPATAMAQVDAVAMPSRWEAYGLVALEARAAGRPLLAARVDGLHDHLAQGAIAVDGDGPMAWAEALNRLQETRHAIDLTARRDAARVEQARFASGWGALIGAITRPAETARAA
ncbi:hypothetical protein roselon_03170 [Roseibacterium elongatum DSM 19469]|uniref:Glycosyltransferase subfamily 4-like N-terminal domain-containing protein n=1 Tax=Roseicyclus elongatus DSM 19469 TaxID=1294273 RepID=W8RVY8_9RHOB|nr:glycosyltransferase [Roseibacterium elongatum]AHM05433.1 hypothetical protein roselon_03170 [Roseibacterium elongatum DSM 19469]